MEKLTIEEKIEINAALHGRVKFMKETIAKLKKMELMHHILSNVYPCVKLLLKKTKFQSIVIKTKKIW